MKNDDLADEKVLEHAINGEKLEALGIVVELISEYNPQSFKDIGVYLGLMIKEYAKRSYDLNQEMWAALKEHYDKEAFEKTE